MIEDPYSALYIYTMYTTHISHIYIYMHIIMIYIYTYVTYVYIYILCILYNICTDHDFLSLSKKSLKMEHVYESSIAWVHILTEARRGNRTGQHNAVLLRLTLRINITEMPVSQDENDPLLGSSLHVCFDDRFVQIVTDYGESRDMLSSIHNTGWWFQSLWKIFPIYGKKHVPNHQPAIINHY